MEDSIDAEEWLRLPYGEQPTPRDTQQERLNPRPITSGLPPRPRPRPSNEGPTSEGRNDSVDSIVRMATATVYARSSREYPIDRVMQVIASCVTRASVKVRMERNKSSDDWDETRLKTEFFNALVSFGEAALGRKFRTELGDRNVDQLIDGSSTVDYDDGSTSITTTSTSSTTNVSSVAPAGSGIKARSSLSLNSSSRNMSYGLLPNVIQVPILGSSGLALPKSMQGVYKVELLEMRMNNSPYFTMKPFGATFYLSIDEITKDYNHQSDPYDTHCHFKCSAEMEQRGSDVRILILTKYIHLPSPIDLGSNLTLRFYDEVKEPLGVEQDVYRYITHTWDDVNQAIVFETAPNSIRNAERISIRNITCTEDSTLFLDSHAYRAEVVDLTHIRIYAWRAQGAPFITPEDGRHIVSSGGVLVCLNNVISVSLAFEHAA